MDLPSGNVCDAQGRIGALDYRIKPVGRVSQLCGTALTVDAGPRDNLAPWAALEIAKPGDVIVINTSRGTIIDEAALCRALEDNKVAAAGLDVFEKEPSFCFGDYW